MRPCSQPGWVHDLCEAAGRPATVASATGAAWQWSCVKRSIVRDEALKLTGLTKRTGAIPWQVYAGDRHWFHSWGQVIAP